MYTLFNLVTRIHTIILCQIGSLDYVNITNLSISNPLCYSLGHLRKKSSIEMKKTSIIFSELLTLNDMKETTYNVTCIILLIIQSHCLYSLQQLSHALLSCLAFRYDLVSCSDKLVSYTLYECIFVPLCLPLLKSYTHCLILYYVHREVCDYLHACLHAYMRLCIQVYTHTCMHASMHAYKYTRVCDACTTSFTLKSSVC